MSKVAQVIVKLKPKVASLGFNRMEIEGVASRIANNLGDDATEEDIDAEIDAVMPYLELAQTSASRIINKSKDGDGNKSTTATGESKKTEKPSDKEGEQANEKEESTGAINLKNMDDLKKLLGGIVSETLSPIAKRLEAIEGSKIADTRLSQVKEIAKKAGGSYEKTLLKNFGRIRHLPTYASTSILLASVHPLYHPLLQTLPFRQKHRYSLIPLIAFPILRL